MSKRVPPAIQTASDDVELRGLKIRKAIGDDAANAVLLQRLPARMREAKLTQSDLARLIGASQGAIQQILSGSSRKSRLLPDIARALGTSVAYLLGDADDPGALAGPLPPTEDEVLEQNGVARVREIDVSYGMGGTFVGDYVEEQWSVFDATWLSRITRSPTEQLFVARGVGDSMMPTLLDSDTLLIDRAQRRILQQDRLWALTYGDIGMIKRVRRLPGGKYLIMSDNDAVPAFEAVDSEIHPIGRVIWIGRAV